ncbi:Flp pilus assembly protein CpaB [Arthrobacter sp. 35W]|uniref:Flp pilus assembly protein CpaB n=1 Tax=Arthrobacter sp. 35W TaxID=1132441 RepID=UPI00047E8C18|nr:RcpC/CpaB family pilus assembly protein [Arthrobacter sp. 35W]
MKTRLLGGVAALVLAIVGAVLLASYVQAADRRAQSGMDPVEVLVVQQPVAAGTTVDQLKELVKAQAVPKASVPEGAVTDLSEFTGKVAAVDLVPGEQLLGARLVDKNALAAPNQVDVPKGLEELTLKLDAERVLGGQLQAGDTVGVFISYMGGVAPGTSDNPATKLQFHKVLVTHVGTGAPAPANGETAPAKDSSAGGSVFITVALSGADAVKAVHGIEFGKIYLSKENADTDTTNVDNLFKDGVLR